METYNIQGEGRGIPRAGNRAGYFPKNFIIPNSVSRPCIDLSRSREVPILKSSVTSTFVRLPDWQRVAITNLHLIQRLLRLIWFIQSLRPRRSGQPLPQEFQWQSASYTTLRIANRPSKYTRRVFLLRYQRRVFDWTLLNPETIMLKRELMKCTPILYICCHLRTCMHLPFMN